MSNKYILDIENYLIPIEEIVNKYIDLIGLKGYENKYRMEF